MNVLGDYGQLQGHPEDAVTPAIEKAVAVNRQRIAAFLYMCSESWGRQADRYEAYGDKEHANACSQTATAFAAAARTIDKGNE